MFTTNEPTTGFALPGTYTVTPAGLTSGNYSITFVPGTLTVIPADDGHRQPTSATSVTLGQPTTLTATVATSSPSTATPTGGTVTFYVDGVAQPNPVACRAASRRWWTRRFRWVRTITASYSGDGAKFVAGGTAVGPGSIITTVAGNGNSQYGGDGGPATAATLTEPWGVAVDSAGNLFIADWSGATPRSSRRPGTLSP